MLIATLRFLFSWFQIVNPYTKYALTMTPINLSIEEALPQKIQSYLVGMFVQTCLVLSNVAVALLFPYFGE
jgi:vesicular inhibitory amino acid transporter